MKNSGREVCRARKWKRITMPNRLTVAIIRKTFTVQSITPQERAEIVTRYMGDSPVPPSWTLASVRGTFGRKIARIWARKLRHRPAGVYRDAASGRLLHPVAQTTYDFGVTPGQTLDQDAIDALKAKLTTPGRGVQLDEFWLIGKTA